MVQGKDDSKFVQYKLVEVITKLNSLITSKKKIRLWKKGEIPFFAQLIDINQSEICFKLSENKAQEFSDDDLILVNFSFNDIDFFLKGHLSFSDEHIIKILAAPEVFKVERRNNERLLAYPHLDVYAYLSFDKIGREIKVEEGSNLLSFKKPKIGEDILLKSFLSSTQDDEFPESWLSEDHSEDIELQGFRVMDISLLGLSFCVNADEGQKISDLRAEQTWEIYMLFDGEAYIIPEANIIYSIDFVNPQSTVVSMKKIGMRFEPTDEFSEKIYSFIDELETSSELEKDFENLI